MNLRKQVRQLPRWLQGKIITDRVKAADFIIHDLDKPTHHVRVFDTFVCIRPVSEHHVVSISSPDPSDSDMPEGCETEIYVWDHAKIYITGKHKGEMTIVVARDEFPVTIKVKRK